MTRYRILPPAKEELRNASRWYEDQREGLGHGSRLQSQLPRSRTLEGSDSLATKVARRANKPKALSAPGTTECRDEGPKLGRCSFGVCQNYALPEQSPVPFDAQ
jgi:hypothetical protein